MKFFPAIILSTLIFPATLAAYSQAPDEQTGYKDFILQDKNVLLLTKAGKLKLINASPGKPPLFIHTDAPVVASAIDRQGNIVVGDTAHQIRQYNYRRKTWHTIAHYSNKLTDIIFTSQNQCLLITNKGIVDAISQTTYFPDSSLSKNSQIRHKKGWFQPPVCFINNQNNLWLGFDYGEWGGDVFCFDTRKRIFSQLQTDSIRLTTNPVNAFCEDSINVYMAGGVSHLFLIHGSILKFNHNIAIPLLLSKNRETPEKVTFKGPDGKQRTEIGATWKGGHQIGPVAYNPINRCLYFYSQYGIFKGDLRLDLSDTKQWQNVLKPKLRWTGGRSNAAGSPMNVLKMRFNSDGTLFFLTEHEGLGVYTGKTLRFIR